MEERLSDLGEAELLLRLAAWAPAGQFEDDAALLEVDGRNQHVRVRRTGILRVASSALRSDTLCD